MSLGQNEPLPDSAYVSDMDFIFVLEGTLQVTLVEFPSRNREMLNYLLNTQ